MGLQLFQLIAKSLPKKRILKMFRNRSTENQNEEIKNKSYSFLLFHWFLLLRIKCFVDYKNGLQQEFPEKQGIFTK